MVRRRLKILMLLSLLPFAVVMGRLGSLQLDYGAHIGWLRRSESTRLRPIAPRRGKILDRHGAVLAEDRTVFHLRVYFADLDPRYRVLHAIHSELTRSAGFEFSFEDVVEHLRKVGDVPGLARSVERAATASPRAGSSADDAFEDDTQLLLIRDIPEASARRIRILLSHEEEPFFYLTASSGAGPGAVHDLWFSPRRALRMEVTLHRLARRIDGVVYEDLLERVEARLAVIERRVDAVVREARRIPDRRQVIVEKLARAERIGWLRTPWTLFSPVSLDLVTEIEYHPELYPGIRVEDGHERRYPPREATGSLVGFLRKLDGADIGRLKQEGSLIDGFAGLRSAEAFDVVRDGAMQRSDEIGAAGLERQYDARLRGSYGMEVVRQSRRDGSGETVTYLAPVPGEDLRTTLDGTLQRIAHDSLRQACLPHGHAVAGSVAVMGLTDGRVGELLVCAGFPGFDANRIREPGYASKGGELEKRYGGQTGGWFFIRPQQGGLFPGSVFKPISAIAGMESGRDHQGPVSPGRQYYCSRTFELHPRLSCTSYHGPVDLARALKFSCNNYFYHLASFHLKPALLHGWARSFGFGTPTGVDLPRSVYAAGGLRPPDQVRGTVALCHFAMGQVWVEATPLQVLCSVAAIALRGRALPRPYLARPVDALPLPPIQKRTMDAIWEGMEEAVTSPGGTAAREHYGLARYRIAVKTGTAQFGEATNDKYHAWIAGFGPLPQPRVAFVVVLEAAPEHGGEACAPVLATLLEAMARAWPESGLLDEAPPESGDDR